MSPGVPAVCRAPWKTALALAVLGAVASHGRADKDRRVAIAIACGDCALVESLALDTWSDARAAGAPMAVVVRARDLRTLRGAGLAWDVIDDDIDATARAEAIRLRSEPAPSALSQPADWFADYRDYRAITARLEMLAQRHPARARLQGIGSSLDGRTIWALRIGATDAAHTPMMINGTQHAREWIAAMVTTCVADRLLADYDTDPKIRAFVDRTTLWVVPVVNPDGYQYAWSTDRYWRKNRRGGFGVDLNRNWSIGWGGTGSSGFKSSQVYRGEAAFSEPESIALRDLARRERIALHLDFHSYGQLLMYPWMHTARPVDGRERYAAIGDRMASAMAAQHATRYQLIAGVELSDTGGTLTDWAHGVAGAMSFTVELRPRGRGGFVLPKEEIRPTCDEGLAAVLELRNARE